MKNYLFLLFFLCGLASNAQDYESAIGLRLGVPASISYKKFLDNSAAMEIYGSFRGRSGYNWLALSGAYQIHNDIPSVNALRWYYGGGASLYFYSFDAGFDDSGEGNLGIGINGYLGLEYTLSNTPISFSLDWVPTIFLIGFNNGFAGGQGALGIRYVLN